MSEPITWTSRTPTLVATVTETADEATSAHGTRVNRAAGTERAKRGRREPDEPLDVVGDALEIVVAGEDPLPLGGRGDPSLGEEHAIERRLDERAGRLDERLGERQNGFAHGRHARKHAGLPVRGRGVGPRPTPRQRSLGYFGRTACQPFTSSHLTIPAVSPL